MIEKTHIRRRQLWQKKDSGAIFEIIKKVGSRWRAANIKRRGLNGSHLIQEHDLHKHWILLK